MYPLLTGKAANPDQRIRSIRVILWVILFLNLGVALAKYLYGVFSYSAAMQADGIHSAFDGMGNVIGLVAIALALRPADHDHPYGHSKYETYASLAIVMLLLFAAYNIGSTAVSDLFHGRFQARADYGSFGVMIITLFVNIAVSTWERRAGKRLNSSILLADANHTLSDIMVSCGVIASLVFVKMGFPVADPIVTIIVAMAILYTSWRVFKQVSATLSDSARIPGDVICREVCAVKGVRGCHRARARGTETEVYLDLHIEVDGEETVSCGHEIAEAVEEMIYAVFPQVVDVTVHIEPYDFPHRDRK